MGGMNATLSRRSWDGNGLERTRVLLVEDDPQAREILSWLLMMQGAEVHTVASVEDALEAFDRVAPDIIVSDINLEDATGFDLVEELRRRGARTPAIAISSERYEHMEVLARGFQGSLRKPVSTAELTSEIGRLTTRRRSA